MCEHLKESSGIRKISEARNNGMVYYQGCQKKNLPEKKILSRDSFSSEELSLSRNSSFSSCSSSATGSSGYGCTLTDSSVSRSSVRLSGMSPRFDSPLKQAITKPDDSARLTRSKHKLDERNSSRQNQALVRNQGESNTVFDKQETSSRLLCFPERSISETELLFSRSHLCSPEGLIISTPRAKGTYLTASEKRPRSKSESYDEKSAPNIKESKEKPKEPGKSKRSVPSKRRETSSVDWCVDEATMRRCLLLLESSSCEGKKGARLKDAAKQIAALESQVEQVYQERDSAIRERNEMMHDRDRIKCERDALELERDNLLRDKDFLEKELINRSHVIDHLKEHLGLAVIPVKLTARQMNCPVSVPVSKEMSTTYQHDAPTGSKFKTRPRSKSEIKPPEFYFPDQILKTNAYTCL